MEDVEVCAAVAVLLRIVCSHIIDERFTMINCSIHVHALG